MKPTTSQVIQGAPKPFGHSGLIRDHQQALGNLWAFVGITAADTVKTVFCWKLPCDSQGQQFAGGVRCEDLDLCCLVNFYGRTVPWDLSPFFAPRDFGRMLPSMKTSTSKKTMVLCMIVEWVYPCLTM